MSFSYKFDSAIYGGFTIVELLVTLAVVAVTTAYAVPGLQTLVANNRQTSVVNRFVASALLARSIAITHNVQAIVCPSSNGLTCLDVNDWSYGWIVVRSDVATDTPATSSHHSLIHSEMGTNKVVVMANRALFRYRPMGKRATNGTVLFCTLGASAPRAVIVSYNGRPRTSAVLPNGNEIVCPA
ncbi:MAG: GspH/FimT family pseudopilin [Gammaproteobacteria bacterium]